MQRVLIIGSGGAGKSTLARALAARTGLPLIHLDALYWQPGWVEPDKAQWRTRIESLVAGQRWIMDGNYGGTLDARLAACDTVIFLDLLAWRCMLRVLRRRMAHRGRTRPDMGAGCPEKLDRAFLHWIWTYPRRRRPDILRRLTMLRADQQAVVLRSDRDVKSWLASVEAEDPDQVTANSKSTTVCLPHSGHQILQRGGMAGRS